MSKRPYRRLPGVRRGVFTRASAWLGSDHILLVEGSRMHESYKRVYLRDILGILNVKRRRIVVQAWWIALLILVPLIFVILAARGFGAFWIGALVDLGILGGLWLVALSQGCKLYIATAVGNLSVPSVFRVWQARKFCAAIERLVTEAQQGERP